MALLVPEAREDAFRMRAPVRTQPHVRRAVPADRDDLDPVRPGPVSLLDPAPVPDRVRGGRVPAALVERLLSGGEGGGALVARVDGRFVAHALWARSDGPQEPVAEIAMVVADAHQGQGIGSLLLEALRAEMQRDGIERVQVVTGAANRPVLGMIARRSPGARAARDGATLTYELPLPSSGDERAPRGLPRRCRPRSASTWSRTRGPVDRQGRAE